MKKSFMLHIDSLNVLSEMNDDQAGKLFKAIAALHSGEEIEMDVLTKIALAPFKAQFARDAESYQKTVERNRNNGSKGGRPNNPTEPKKPSGLSGLSKEPKKPDSDKDKDSDSKKDNKKNKSSSGEPEVLTKEFVDLYNKFLILKTGVGEQVTAAGRTSLKKIIQYLKSQVETKHQGATPEIIQAETVNAWKWVLANYDQWEAFHRGQLKLEQINSNLINIINTVKNGRQSNLHKPTRDLSKLASDAINLSRSRAENATNSSDAQDG